MGLALKKESINQQTVVIGLGETGISVANYLSKQGIDFKVFDTRSNPPQLTIFKQKYPSVEIQLGEFSVKDFQDAQQIIASPGIDINQTEIREAIIQNDCECIGDIELFARGVNKPVVAITGSNGKSTVTSLVAEMANTAGVKAYAGGNLSPPALSLLENDDAELFVLELSSFQLESTYSLKPTVSAVLNVSPDHLDRHGDIDNYARIKERIYTNAVSSIINIDDSFVANMKTSGQVVSFSSQQPEDDEFGVIQQEDLLYLAFGNNALLPVSELALRGEAGILNSLAALAIGQALKLPMQKMLETLKTFKGLPHRLALVAELNGVSWFNDSKGTNIGATVSSLRSLENNIILIAGGIFKGGDLEFLTHAIKQHAKHVILIGQASKLFQQALKNSIEVSYADSMQHAVGIAQQIAVECDKVLLSPACASFDMYSNYIERGKDFENCVREVL